MSWEAMGLTEWEQGGRRKYERYPSTTHLSTLPMANGGGEIIALAAWQRMLKMLRYSRGGT